MTSHKEPMLNIGQLSARLGFAVTAAFLEKLGFTPAAPDSLAKLYKKADYPRICEAIRTHLATRSEPEKIDSLNPFSMQAEYTAFDGDQKEWFVVTDDGNPIAKVYGKQADKIATLFASATELLIALGIARSFICSEYAALQAIPYIDTSHIEDYGRVLQFIDMALRQSMCQTNKFTAKDEVAA